MLYVCPPIVIVPVRSDASVLEETVKLTNPSPVPLAPEVIVIQLTSLAAVQLHPLGVVTAIPADTPSLLRY